MRPSHLLGTGRRIVVQPYTVPTRPRLPSLVDYESFGKRLLFSVVAFALSLAFLAMSLCYWAPAHPGIDQNGYLVGGRMLAEHGSTSFTPAEPYAFVGAMWVGTRLDTPHPEYFPKYPIGLPLLNALCLKAGPLWAAVRPQLIDLPILHSTTLWMARPDGTALAYLLSPILMTAALWAMFLLGRLVGGSFGGIMAMLLLATCQITLTLAKNPNSHASDLCFVTWGVYWLVRWWQTDRLWRGVLAGLSLGFAVTIRYSEGLLLLPLAVAAITLPWRRSWITLAAWAIPVVALLVFNLHFIGHWTGYDPTRESAGFSWRHFQSKWEFVTQTLYDNSIFFLPPIAIFGIIAIFRHSVRWGLLLATWFFPGALLYTAYYWGGDTFGSAYSRLYLSLLPPLVLAAVWLMVNQAQSPIGAGIVVAIASVIGLRTALPTMERDLASNLNLAFTVNRIVGHLPPGKSMVIADQPSNLSMLDNALQFAGDFDLYTTEAFHPPQGARQLNPDQAGPDQARPDQAARRDFLSDVFKGKSDADLLKEAHRVMQSALDAGKPVYVVLQPEFSDAFRNTYMTNGFSGTLIDRWKEPAAVPPEEKGGPLSPEAHGFVFNWIRAAQSFEMWQIIGPIHGQD